MYKYNGSRFIAVTNIAAAEGFFHGCLKVSWDPEYASDAQILASL